MISIIFLIIGIGLFCVDWRLGIGCLLVAIFTAIPKSNKATTQSQTTVWKDIDYTNLGKK